jgi:hypothetical protein
LTFVILRSYLSSFNTWRKKSFVTMVLGGM